MSRAVFLVLLWMPSYAPLMAGTGYKITSKQGDASISYTVKFGGGKLFEQYTAFDPDTQAFVYLRWPRNQKPPRPHHAIWNHETWRRIDLYKFPKAKHPLPVIPSLDQMKACPKTGDRNYRSKATLAYD